MTVPSMIPPPDTGDDGGAGDPMRRLLRGRIPALDGVRGVAILLVLLHQFNVVEGTSLAARLWTEVVEPGWIGVQLFFVLSGFLITGILLDAKGKGRFFGRFYRRRVRRIVPLYYLVLAVVFIVLPLAGRHPLAGELSGDRRGHVWYWLYLQNWPLPSLRGGGAAELLGHTWSLAVEEQYYLVWPLAVWALGRRGLYRLCVAVAVGALLLRFGMRAAGVAPEIIYMATWGRADALALGGLCALFVRRDDWRVFGQRTRARATVVTVTLAALVAAAVASHDFSRKLAATQIAGYSVLAVAFAVFIAAAVTQSATGGGRLVSALSFRPLQAIGRVSYGMYLFHLPLHLLATRLVLARFLDRDGNTTSVVFGFAYLIVATAALYGLAWLSWTQFERRFLTPSPRERPA